MTIRNAARCLWFHCTSRRGWLSSRASVSAVALTLFVGFAAPTFAAAIPPDDAPLVVSTPANPPTSPVVETATKPDYHDDASAVDIYASLTDDMFPAEWHDPDVAVVASPLAPVERDRMLRLMKIALSKYPPALLKANQFRIYLVGGLKFEGIEAAATNSINALYIEDEVNNPFYTDRFIEDSFHHELAHLLQRNYRDQWNDAAWAACNPIGFSYRATSGVEAVRAEHDSEEPTDDWNRRGFLCEYGASDAAEDFATIAADVAMGDTDFWTRADRFPALKTKIDLIVAFFAKLDDRFAEPYFRALRPGIVYVAPAIPPNTAVAETTPPGSPANLPPAASAAPDNTVPAAKP